MVRELKPHEFDEYWLRPVFEEVEKRVGLVGNYQHFFPTWRRYMEFGLARTWHAPGAVLGALVIENLYTAEKEFLVAFWFSNEEGRKLKNPVKLLDEVEKVAVSSGAKKISIAAYASLNGEAISQKYLKRGYQKLETTFRKTL